MWARKTQLAGNLFQCQASDVGGRRAALRTFADTLRAAITDCVPIFALSDRREHRLHTDRTIQLRTQGIVIAALALGSQSLAIVAEWALSATASVPAGSARAA